MKVHEKIRFLRESRKLSQEDMANKLNMSVSGYSKIERGESKTHFDKLEQIAEAFDFDDVMELIALGERYILINENGNSNIHNGNYIISESQLVSENEKLQLVITHKDELIIFKDELINQLRQENSYLKSVLNSQDESK
jgi:transcriptional regulator with XRE-family HTH domain